MVAIASRQSCLMLHLDTDETDAQNLPILGFLKDIESETKCPLCHVISMWIGPEELVGIIDKLKRLAVGTSRNMLLVSGHYLEDQVTVCCLEALMEGFDVHLLCDFSAGFFSCTGVTATSLSSRCSSFVSAPVPLLMACCGD
jgi:hypothetical protein